MSKSELPPEWFHANALLNATQAAMTLAKLAGWPEVEAPLREAFVAALHLQGDILRAMRQEMVP